MKTGANDAPVRKATGNETCPLLSEVSQQRNVLMCAASGFGPLTLPNQGNVLTD